MARKEGFELDGVEKTEKNSMKLRAIPFVLSSCSGNRVHPRSSWLFRVKGKNKGKLFAGKPDYT